MHLIRESGSSFGVLHRRGVSKVKPTRCTTVSNLFDFGITLYIFRTGFRPSSGVSGVPRNFFVGGDFNKFSWGQRTERTGIWGRSPLVRGSGGSCNLVKEISFHIVKFS